MLLVSFLFAGAAIAAIIPSNDQTVLTAYPRTILPVDNPTKSFWIDSSPDANPLAHVGSEGPLTQKADVCIIGSGITGVSVAYHLSKSPVTSSLKTVIFEARDFCSAATGRNGGHLTPAVCNGFSSLQKLYGTDDAIRSFDIERHTADSIVNLIREHGLETAVDLVEGGHISLFLDEESEAKALADYRDAITAGMNFSNARWIEKDEMKSRFGTPYSAMKFQAYNLWPLKFVTQAFKLANSSMENLVLHTRTPVTSVSYSDSWNVTTPRGSVDCKTLVHATNGYAGYLLPEMNGPGGVVPTRGQLVATRSSASLESLGISSWSNSGFEYWFPRPEPETPLVILGGGRKGFSEGYESYVVDDSTLNAEIGHTLRAFLPKMFPTKFEEAKEPEMEWTGIMGYTAMGDPFVGPISDGQYISVGYSGHGMPRAFSCGEVIASMLISNISDVPWTSPEWLPRRYLTWNRF